MKKTTICETKINEMHYGIVFNKEKVVFNQNFKI